MGALVAKNRFTSPVLTDDGYVADKAKINAFPTAWFPAREGGKIFVKEGASEKLVEEFSWRIDAIKQAHHAAPDDKRSRAAGAQGPAARFAYRVPGRSTCGGSRC